MSYATKEQVIRKTFSQEYISSEIKRVKEAPKGTVVYEMDSWECPMLAEVILQWAGISYQVTTDEYRTARYLKS